MNCIKMHSEIMNFKEITKTVRNFVFDTQEHFEEWINGEYEREDKRTIVDLKSGDIVFIEEENISYWSPSNEVESINDLNKIVEPVKPNLLFSQTESKVVTCDGTAKSIIGDGVGSLTFEANSFKKGDQIQMFFSGIVSSANHNNITLTIKLNNVVLYTYTSSSGITFTNTPYNNMGYIVIREIGENGEIVIAGTRNIFSAQGFGTVTSLAMRGSANIDTTIDNTLSVEYTAPNGDSLTNESLVIIKQSI